MSVCASICLFVFFPEFLKTAELIEIIFLRTILLGVHMDLGKESGRGEEEVHFLLLGSRKLESIYHLE